MKSILGFIGGGLISGGVWAGHLDQYWLGIGMALVGMVMVQVPYILEEMGR
jgi:hypothetical protein